MGIYRTIIATTVALPIWWALSLGTAIVANRETLESTLSPLRSQLKDFRKRVDDVYDKEARDRTTLLAELGQLKELNRQMSEDAINLTRALKGDSKTQGNWGEVVLERVLEESGLRKGHEYETQVSARTARP